MIIETVIEGIPLILDTAPGLFSPSAIDAGTAALLATVPLESHDKVLDLGCGYGTMGIYAAKRLTPQQIHMIDNDPKAIELAGQNIIRNAVTGAHVQLSEGLRDLHETGFTKILCNPPYHTDFSVAKHFIEKGFNRLTLAGEMWMVTKRSKWYANKLRSVFGGARVTEHGGYFIFQAIKKTATYAGHLVKQR